MMDEKVPEKTEPLARIDMTGLLQALADPIRMQIISGLDRLGESGCTALHLPVAKSTASHHFQILRNAGIIATRQVGTARISRLRREEMEHYFPGLLPAILASAEKSAS